MKKRFLAYICGLTLLVAGCGTAGNSAMEETVRSDTADTTATILLQGDSATCEDASVKMEDGTVTITAGGTYVLQGTLNDGIVIVDADSKDDVQLVLDGVELSNEDGAAIYVKNADRVTVSTTAGTKNTLVNAGEFVAIDDNNIDGVIFSKDDLTLNGEGTLILKSDYGHGVVSKDDLHVDGGTIEIQVAKHGLSGKDSVNITGGNVEITCGKDGIHSANDDDATLGSTYISGGEITIISEDDGIHSDNELVITDGKLVIPESYEGLEAMIVEIAGGEVIVNADDDGVNASGGTVNSSTSRPQVPTR